MVPGDHIIQTLIDAWLDVAMMLADGNELSQHILRPIRYTKLIRVETFVSDSVSTKGAQTILTSLNIPFLCSASRVAACSSKGVSKSAVWQ